MTKLLFFLLVFLYAFTWHVFPFVLFVGLIVLLCMADLAK